MISHSCPRSGRATVRGRPVAPLRAGTAKLVSGPTHMQIGRDAGRSLGEVVASART
jgi:hypothetical protein